ncbi:uncharacterized protein LOC103573353 [Microplitis demolitor]|uniref:uncharacterized protein LOC103573353 n=1 Tax=Microplitis demolitor TaxID=69319 RepID=UPI0004CD6CF0|nr:uncharacterized protein LOC103573353 [Microplitis demolitor]XP_008550614.1 uncharacterized protein LOC103573353 [Microplitis demolitor]XP_008550615.1 uncharacterized protein LOC103573353 [Microplitis demolitor]XP_008550616.1 uncharacterized protein LOC103573353 [Microplitis demolitor]XP_053593064.1 uncharacterized protein LOC103573353 [Microplitis demolitor]XP_053593066.1 uncharacterized protein LOC103573353 [Microplitis demolitor]XP_053593069.1 uncharacterized protein LOC103573353 [Microp
MDFEKTRNGTGETDDDYTNIHFIVGDRREIASFRPDQVTNKELKELFRSAAEAGPLDIVKLRKGDKLLNISPQLPANTPDTPYVLQVVGAHPTSVGMIEADLLRALEKRVAALERELGAQQAVASSEPAHLLRELKRQMDAFKTKLETTEHLSWLGFYKQLPEPVSSEACRRLQYRRKSDSVKRRVREKFLNICDVSVSSSVREWLRSPAFDARQWEDEELLLMLQTMFVELELPQKFNIPLPTLRNFLYEVYNNYNEVPFHNFRHCFCVAQMMYAIAWAVDLPSKIGHLEVLILIVSCICHDLDHPGYNNIYQINARTELALRYNDISPLENHHCSVAFRVLEAPECNILASLDATTFRTVREGIIRCILATDMARHNEILGQFTDVVQEFDYQNRAHINLLSMILIKVADISNEARPMDVAEPWLDRLLQEFFKQSDAEKLEGLPVTPFMDRDKVTKPSSQCSFIGLVLLPLFEVLGDLFPELQELIVSPVKYALDYYRRLNEAAKDERHHRKSIVDLGESTMSSSHTGSSSVIKSTSSHSMRSKRSAGTIRSRSRSIEDEADNQMLEELENIESSDPETATEVEISEKTLKFKISTEGNVAPSSTGRKSYPGSRKGSRDKSSLDYHNHDLAKAVRDHERERRKSRGENLSSDMSSPVSARSGDDTRILEEFERDEILCIEARINKDDSKLSEENGNGFVESSILEKYNKSNKRMSIDVDDNNTSCSSSGRINRKELVVMTDANLRCCCDDKSSSSNNHHKSLLSRLRNLTDRLSISFDSKDPPITKSKHHHHHVVTKTLSKSNSVVSGSVGVGSGGGGGSSNSSSILICKRCNLTKSTKDSSNSGGGGGGGSGSTVVALTSMDKRAMTLPKTRKSHDGRTKSWRMVFTKEKRPSASLEVLPAHDSSCDSSIVKHKRNLSNPEGKMSITKSSVKDIKEQKKINFSEINVRTGAVTKSKPDIVVHPGSSSIVDEDIDKVEIRRSSASMEDISKITKQNEVALLGSLEDKKSEEMQHTGSLDSMLYKECAKTTKKAFVFASPSSTKKSSPSLFSRFKSGMSIDGTRSNSGSLNENNQQSPSWISSLTASFRPKRHGDIAGPTSHQLHSPTHEEVK